MSPDLHMTRDVFTGSSFSFHSKSVIFFFSWFSDFASNNLAQGIWTLLLNHKFQAKLLIMYLQTKHQNRSSLNGTLK